jgi:hypothetical protein
MALSFLKKFEEDPKIDEKTILHLAAASVQRSLRIMSSGRWPTVDFALKRYHKEHDEIEELQKCISNLGGVAHDFFAYMSTNGDTAPTSLKSFKWEDVVWINDECRRAAGNKDLEEEEPKSVREL